MLNRTKDRPDIPTQYFSTTLPATPELCDAVEVLIRQPILIELSSESREAYSLLTSHFERVEGESNITVGFVACDSRWLPCDPPRFSAEKLAKAMCDAISSEPRKLFPSHLDQSLIRQINQSRVIVQILKNVNRQFVRFKPHGNVKFVATRFD